MNTRKLKAKLSLNKQTISNVNMNSIKVGGNELPLTFECYSSGGWDEPMDFGASCTCPTPPSGVYSIGYSCGQECWDPY